MQIFAASPVYLFNLSYESPSLLAPAFISVIPYSQNINLQLGLVGYSILAKTDYSMNKNLSLGISQDITPKNSNASIYQYANGKRDESLNYENSTILSQCYIRVKRTRDWSSQYSFIYLNEIVNNTDNDKYWDTPHIGISIQENWSIVEYEDFFNNRWDGTKVSGNLEIFPNAKNWYRGQLTGGIGYFNQPWHLIVSGKLFFSKNLNIVNQFIVGSPWELDLLNFMQGSHYGEYRIHEGMLLNIRTDYEIKKIADIGLRISFLHDGEESYLGYGFKIITIYEGLVFNIGLSISGKKLKEGEFNTPIVTSGVTFGIM